MSGWTIVLDVGKTLSKVSLWDEGGRCIATRSRLNERPTAGSSAILDCVGIEHWLSGVLSEYARLGPVSAIVPVAHGAGLALIHRGRLQSAPLDYEWAGVATARASYDPQRDRFCDTGSPALPAGLNLGMQLHWLEALHPEESRVGCIVPWAQYWAWLLSGVMASEVTSLGCHSDLWLPYRAAPSHLAISRGWAERLAPLMPAHRVLGTLATQWSRKTGLSPRVEVYCGLHDSNAALLDARSHCALASHDSTVLSTGTWFIAMRSPLRNDQSNADALSENRDCLVNVDVAGSPVPSARFMGGREIELLIGPRSHFTCTDASSLEADSAFLVEAIRQGTMILPTGVPGVGPYPSSSRPNQDAPRLTHSVALAHLYAALMADASLDLIGSCDTVLVEGRFSSAPLFVRALATLRPSARVLLSADENGVARGALRLANVDMQAYPPLETAQPLAIDLREYRNRWREAAERVH